MKIKDELRAYLSMQEEYTNVGGVTYEYAYDMLVKKIYELIEPKVNDVLLEDESEDLIMVGEK